MQERDNAERFLAKWNMGLDDLRRHVQGLDRTETMLLVGSIPDGLANSASDIDIMIIGDRGLDATLVFQETGYEQAHSRLPQGQEINIEYWRAEDLEQLQRRLDSIIAALYDPTKLRRLEVFSDAELRLLHRIRAGVVLANPERAEAWRKEMRVAALPDYLVLYWISMHYTLREDAIAQVQEGDALSAHCMLRFVLDFLGGAMLASVEETNPYAKWRPRLLERNRATLGSQQVDTLLQYMFSEAKKGLTEHLREVIAFSDAALDESIRRRPAVVPAMLELNKRLLYVKHLEEQPS